MVVGPQLVAANGWPGALFMTKGPFSGAVCSDDDRESMDGGSVVDLEKPESGLVDTRVNVRIVLAMLWICHFILWIFGDMFALLQEMGEPATDTSVQFIAPTTAIVLTLLVGFSLVGRPARVRMANLIVAPLYLMFNIVFFVDATQGWEYYLGSFYALFSVLIIWRAYTWPAQEGDH